MLCVNCWVINATPVSLCCRMNCEALPFFGACDWCFWLWGINKLSPEDCADCEPQATGRCLPSTAAEPVPQPDFPFQGLCDQCFFWLVVDECDCLPSEEPDCPDWQLISFLDCRNINQVVGLPTLYYSSLRVFFQLGRVCLPFYLRLAVLRIPRRFHHVTGRPCFCDSCLDTTTWTCPRTEPDWC